MYPDTPGYKTTGPSKEVAQDIQSDARNVRARVLKTIKDSVAGLTAQEIGLELNPDLSPREAREWVKPRISELRNKGEIRDSGLRRANDSGKKVTVWEQGIDQEYFEKKEIRSDIKAMRRENAAADSIFYHLERSNIFLEALFHLVESEDMRGDISNQVLTNLVAMLNYKNPHILENNDDQTN
jgi:hypothetical protein